MDSPFSDMSPVVRTPVVLRAPLAPVVQGLMPDLRGLGAREALRTLTALGMTARITGSGVVISHSPEPGEPALPGSTAVVRLDRRVPAVPAASGNQ